MTCCCPFCLHTTYSFVSGCQQLPGPPVTSLVLCLQEIREKESVAALWQLLGSLVPASGVAAGVMERLPQPAAEVTVADR